MLQEINVEEVPYCRVCHEGDTSNSSIGDAAVSLGPLYHPCKCDGSIKYVHQECLIQWLKISKKFQTNPKCELQYVVSCFISRTYMHWMHPAMFSWLLKTHSSSCYHVCYCSSSISLDCYLPAQFGWCSYLCSPTTGWSSAGAWYRHGTSRYARQYWLSIGEI